MLYYIYILSGPLKNTILPLAPNHYVFFLYNNEYSEIEKNDDKTTIYIPCNKNEDKKKLSIILNEENRENNKYKIESSVIPKEIGKEYPLPINKPIYLNDIPAFLISDKSDLPFHSLDFKQRKKRKTITKRNLISLFLIFLLFIALFLYIEMPIEKKEASIVSKSLNFKGFKGNNGYYCIYDDLYPKVRIKNELETNNLYIDIEKIKSLSIENNKKITHITLKDKNKPIITFLYHNENERLKIIDNINNVFSKDCQPIIKEVSIPYIIKDINKFEFTQTIGYTIEEKNNGVMFIFDDEINNKNKMMLDSYIKKQTAIFGRKFISYRENRQVPILKNKAILQEDRGYIFLDSQHRYFPQG
ncbi:hypothetical protein [Proteus sp. FME41]|uniref:hypothetical protein n=1 Tax=Proteus sp. FME41 TaxID=2742608 RepID=UPI001866F8F7|nr:hypothetical protein [Proteus sp. FME41]